MEEGKGALRTKAYRNVLKEYGYPEEEIARRLDEAWRTIFYGSEDDRLFFPVGSDMGYLLDSGNGDARTEGMSYAMMMCVQMDKKEEFDRIWKWALTYMRQDEGKYAGFFAWSVSPSGVKNAHGPASDGEEYFALALLFASHRWGDGPAPFDYGVQAKALLRECLHKGESGPGEPLWDPRSKLIKFIPETPWTDPSYHLPHFYELFALWGPSEDTAFWREAAAASRAFLEKSCHPVTGLAPEYADFEGRPFKAPWTYGHHHFFSDSYRVALNVGLDCEWFGGTEWEGAEADRILAFFADKRPEDFRMYAIDGQALEEQARHPVGLLATNATAALASGGKNAEKALRLFWGTPLRTGKNRYYDNCLYFFALLALSGNYRIWEPRR
jgi:oligosaccharide reducing-end xylanase